MTDKELQKIKDSLPKWDEQNEEEKKLDNELSCREMINSILIYGYLNNTVDEIYENKYLRGYKKDISEERIKELIKEQQEDLKKSKINQDVYTDSEGVTYNSVSWYDDSDNESADKKTEADEIDSDKLWGIHIRSMASGAESTLKLDGKYVAFTNKDEASKCRQSMDDNNGYINNFLVNTLEDLSHVDESSLQIFDTFEEYKEYSDKVVNDFIKSEEEKHNRLEKLRDSIMYKLVDDLKDAGFNVLDVGEDAWKVKHTDFNDVGVRPDIYCYIIIDAGVSYEGRSYGSRKYSVNEDGLISTTDYNNYKPYDEYKDTIIKDIKNLVDANRRSRKEESKSLNESLGSRYEVWERYFEDGEPAKSEYVQSFDNYEDASRFVDGLNEDPNCSAWIVDTMQKESKELRKYNSRLYGVYDTEKEEYTDTGTLEDMKNEVENDKEDVEETQKEPKEDKKDININITVKNESLNDKNKILSKVFANYPDISEEDEDYLNGLSLEELIIELRSRGWEDTLEENKEIKTEATDKEAEIMLHIQNWMEVNDFEDAYEKGMIKPRPDFDYMKKQDLDDFISRKRSWVAYKDKDSLHDFDDMVNSLKYTYRDKQNNEDEEENIKVLDTCKVDGKSIALIIHNDEGRRKYGIIERYKMVDGNVVDYGCVTHYYTDADCKEAFEKLKQKSDVSSNELKTESFKEESVDPIINPDDKFYKDGHLFKVLLYPGAGAELIPYYVYADYEQDALEILVPYLEENAPGLVINIEDLEDEELDNYITVDGIHYLDYNTYIEELDGEEKEKIETEFFKNYKEEE